MFLHNFKYSLKTLFKNKMLIFWTFAFPIILGTFFNMAFADVINKEKLSIIDIAIIDNEDYQNNKIFKTAFESLSDENSEDQMFNTKLLDEEKAKEMLNKEEIVGYLKMQGNDPKLVFQKNGVNQTIFKYVVEEIVQRSSIVENISKDEIKKQIEQGNFAVDAESIVKRVINETSNTEIEFENTANKNLNYMMIEFYTLIAMTCLYGGILGMVAINQTLPNMSNKGKRVAVAPTKKGTIILSSLLAGYVAQLLGLVILFAYTIFALKVDYGEHTGLVILLAMIGSLTGLSMGVAVGTLSKKSEGAKSGILIAITMTGCFFAGMMGVTLKYVIDKGMPIINKINPANMITDGFYSLYYYNTLDRFWFNVASLGVLCVVLITISFLSLRRQKYDSI
ncbi:MAG: ABC transporter permease [Clostridia bacterium]|nr:ABC transporter permease [Clostridia bacterium]